MKAAGFPLVGAVDLDRAEAAFVPHSERYEEWLALGYAGEMQYLARGADRRADPRLVFPETRSILCVAWPYSWRMPDEGPKFARYLRGPDYHSSIRDRLEEALESLEDPLLKWKICVDTSAVLERSWAALCGLGWIGKNTMLIHPEYGSYLFLATVLLNCETGRGPSPMKDHCGKCEACLHACPTSAFKGPGWLDARKCISYLTLEKRGLSELEGDSAQRDGWVAGCDRCQEVCPFNQRVERLDKHFFDEEDLCLETEWTQLILVKDYAERTRKSALSRVRPAEFQRNLILALLSAIRSGSLSGVPQVQDALKTRIAIEPQGLLRAGFEKCLSELLSKSQSIENDGKTIGRWKTKREDVLTGRQVL